MNWSDIWKIVVTAMLSIGGASGLIFILIKFSAEKIAERLSKKYEYMLNEKLETYKSELDKKNYISKARFDLEFSIYGEISEALLIAVESCFWLFPSCLDSIPEDEDKAEEMYRKRYETAINNVVKLQRLLGSKSPFISEELYNDFMGIKKLLTLQVNMYAYCGALQKRKGIFNKTMADAESEAWLRTVEISNKHNDIIIKMRSYFELLEISKE